MSSSSPVGTRKYCTRNSRSVNASASRGLHRRPTTRCSREVYENERQRSGGVDIQDPSSMIYLGERNDVGNYLSAAHWHDGSIGSWN
jgi:hypothetical protein